MITYLDRTFKEDQNYINFKMKLFYQIGVNFNFIYQVSDAQTTQNKINTWNILVFGVLIKY